MPGTTSSSAIREAAAGGCGVLVASVDAADLAVLCDRVLVFRDGQVTAELTGDLTQDDIIHATFDERRLEQTQERGGRLMDTARARAIRRPPRPAEPPARRGAP